MLFSETFNNIEGTGGNDNQWTDAIAGVQMNLDDANTDMKGWSSESGMVYAAKECIMLGTSSINGDITTPAFAIAGPSTLTFRAGALRNKGDGSTLELYVDNGTITPSRVSMTKGAFLDREAVITATGKVKITFKAQKGHFLLDDVMVTDGVNNTTAIQTVRTDATDQPRYFTLDGRFAGNDLSLLRKGIYLVNGRAVVVK